MQSSQARQRKLEKKRARRELKNWNTNEFVTVPNVASALRLGPRGDRWFIDRLRELALGIRA